MKITPEMQFAGLPAYRVRAILRQSGKNLVWPLCCYPAYVPPAATLAVLGKLVAIGSLRLNNDQDSLKFFQRTSLGSALSNAPVPAPLTVPEALSVVGHVIEFLRARSRDDTEKLEVAELRIIGELVSGKEPVPHVELGVVLRYRQGVLSGDLDDPYNVEDDVAECFLTRLDGIHPSVCVRRLPPASAQQKAV